MKNKIIKDNTYTDLRFSTYDNVANIIAAIVQIVPVSVNKVPLKSKNLTGISNKMHPIVIVVAIVFTLSLEFFLK